MRQLYSCKAPGRLTGALVLLAVPALAAAADTTASGGETVDLGSAVIESGTYSATTGGRITSDVTTLGTDDGTKIELGEITLSADGTGSTVDFSNVSSIGVDFGSDSRDEVSGKLTVQATDGGQVDLSGMQHTLLYNQQDWNWNDDAVLDYMVYMFKQNDFIDVSATGAQSTVDLSGLTAAGLGTLSATDGGTIDLSAADHLEFMDITVAGGGQIIGTPKELSYSAVTIADPDSSFDLSGLETMKQSSLTVQGGTQLDLGTTAIDGTSFRAEAGSGITSAATSWVATDWMSNHYNVTAVGTDAVVDLSALTEMSFIQQDVGEITLDIAAEDNGRVDLSGLRSIDTTVFDRVYVDATGGTVDLSSLEVTAVITASATEGGRLLLGDLSEVYDLWSSKITAASGGEVQMGNRVQVGMYKFSAAEGGTVRVGSSTAADYDTGAIVVGSNGTLGGNGYVQGNLYNTGNLGFEDYVDGVTVTGDFHQLAGGTLNIELSAAWNRVDSDIWNITGDAWLAGDINLSFDDDLELSVGDSWDIFNVDGTIFGQFAALNLLSSSTFDFVLDYSDPNMVRLVAQAAGTTPVDPANPVPLPATFWLMGSGLAYLAGKRKMGKKGVAEQA